MCLICIGLENESLTVIEASRNLVEMVDFIDKEHLNEVAEKINELLCEKYVNTCDFCGQEPCDCDWG